MKAPAGFAELLELKTAQDALKLVVQNTAETLRGEFEADVGLFYPYGTKGDKLDAVVSADWKAYDKIAAPEIKVDDFNTASGKAETARDDYHKFLEGNADILAVYGNKLNEPF